MTQGKKNSILKRILILGVVLLISCFVFGRIATLGLLYSDNFLTGSLLMFSSSNFLNLLLSDPFYINLSNSQVLIAIAVGASIPLLLMLSANSKGQKVNEDTEHAHGDSRLANQNEMSDLMDTKYEFNNLRYTEHSGIVFKAHDKKTSKALYGRNFNCITLGISGLGKTFNLVMPDIMQSVGNALVPYYYGFTSSVILRAKMLLGYEPNTVWPSAEEANKRLSAKALKADIGSGFDFFTTDPKGDTLRDTGHMLAAAGFKIRAMNTVDVRDSCHANPLAYIPTKTCDVADPADIVFDIEADITSVAGSTNQRSLKLGDSFDFAASDNSDDVPSNIVCQISSDFETKSDSIDDLPSTTLSTEELQQKLNDLEPGTDKFNLVQAQLNMRLIETEFGTYTQTDGSKVQGHGLEKVADAIKSFSYNRTEGNIYIVLQNRTAKKQTFSCTINLPRSIIVDDKDWGSTRSAQTNKNGHFLSISMPDARTITFSASLKPNAYQPLEVVIPIHIKQQKLPDGVELTKIVDTLVANLGSGTDAQSNNSNDPFWEDTKRLCFMSIIAFLFEKYDAEDQTIPKMMELLIRVLNDDGDPHAVSAYKIMMHSWEYGEEWSSGDDEIDPNDMMSSGPGGRWVQSSDIPHSRNTSLALHRYYAFTQCADDTLLSIIISCRAALTALLSDEIKEMLSKDELELDKLGSPDQKSAIFCITSDVPSPYDFLTALVVQIAIDRCQNNAYRRFGGKLPRHVRFILDEVANIGKIPVLVRASAVIRSRNMSMSLFLQSKSQLAMVYGEKDADVIFDNCSTWLFLGAQTPETLDLIANKIGDETVYTRVLNRSFNPNAIIGATSKSESLQATARKVRSASQLQQMKPDRMLCFIYNHLPIEDEKIHTLEHPMYRYVNPTSPRTFKQPPAAFSERFNYKRYLELQRSKSVERRNQDAAA